MVDSHALLTRLPLPLRGARLACVKPAASVRSEPGSNSQVEKLILASGHAWIDENITPYALCVRSVTFLSKREPPKSRLGFHRPFGLRDPASLCRPRFSFFHLQLSKTRQHLVVFGPTLLWLQPYECRLRGSLYGLTRASVLAASGAAALVVRRI